MSVSSVCLNLDLFSSSSEDDSKDSLITLFCDSNEADTRVKSDQALSDGQATGRPGGVPVRWAVRSWGRLRTINSMIPLFRLLIL